MIAPPTEVAPRGSYPLWLIALMVAMVLDGAALRTLVRLYQRLHEHFPQLFPEPPHWTTCRFWLLRLGLYMLVRAKERATDWIWILDFEAPAGHQKCLTILGIRRAHLPPPGESLQLRHLEPVAIVPCDRSNKEFVLEQLNRHTEITGVPCEIVSDHGPDLKAGVQEFCREHPQTRPVYDVVHKTACLLKARLERDPQWEEFQKQVAATRRQMVQTEADFLCPVTQRRQARYLNLEPLLNWAQRSLTILDQQPAVVLKHCSVERLEAKLGWLRKYQSSLLQWREWWTLTNACVDELRRWGLTCDTPQRIRGRLTALATSPSGETLREELIAFASQQAQGLKPGERLPATSEVIESCFGKRKAVAGEPANRGVTGMILSLGAVVVNVSEQLVQTALGAVPTKTMKSWLSKHLGSTTQSKRLATCAALKSAQEKPEEPLPAST